MRLSFAVTAFEEMTPERQNGRRLERCITAASQHPAISEIIIVDDSITRVGSLPTCLSRLPRVKLFYNSDNLGVFGNKLEAIARCTGDWVVTCDSDNQMGGDFIDRILQQPMNPSHWYCPSFARPRFDYRVWAGKHRLDNINKPIMQGGLFNCCINTGNQTVNRSEFMRVFEMYRGRRADLVMPNWLDLPDAERSEWHWRIVFDACDSLIFNMQWLLHGGTLDIVPGLEYDHHYTSGDESHYNRAPKDKHRLNEILLAELLRVSNEAARRRMMP